MDPESGANTAACADEAGSMIVSLLTALLHSPCSLLRLQDIWYRKAKEYGFRARSAFKLLQCDDSCHIFGTTPEGGPTVTRAVDLCAAPGSWSQVLVRKLYGSSGGARSTVVPSDPALARIVSVDLQEMAPLDGVHMLRGDITSRRTADAIIDHFRGEPVDLVISDGAPDVTGMHEIDEYMQSQLILAALNITSHILKAGTGIFVAKIFKAEAFDLLAAQLRIFFDSVQCVKPPSSRAKSAEHFIVCKQHRKPPGYRAVFLDAVPATATPATTAAESEDAASHLNQLIMPFLRCGDLAPHDQLATDEADATQPKEESYTRFLDGLIDE